MKIGKEDLGQGAWYKGTELWDSITGKCRVLKSSNIENLWGGDHRHQNALDFICSKVILWSSKHHIYHIKSSHFGS